MGMEIDEHIEVLKSYHNGFTGYVGNLQDSIDVAITAMQKYQKIEKIINAPIGGTSAKYNAIVNLIKYGEVENGNDD